MDRDGGDDLDNNDDLPRIMRTTDRDEVLSTVASHLMDRANQEILRLTSGALTPGQFIHEFLQEHIILEPEIVHTVETFGLWLVDQLMPRRSARMSSHQILAGITQDICISGRRILHVQITDDNGTRLSYASAGEGVRVYCVNRDSRCTINALNLGVAPATIVPVYADEHGEDRKEPMELLPRAEKHTPVCASILSAGETEDRWRLELNDGRSLVVVRLCAAEAS